MRRFFLKLLRRRQLQRDLEAELAFHHEMSTEKQNPIPFGNTAVLREQALDLWRFNFAENLWRDGICAARGLRRSPTLVAAALVSLGLAIGVNTAIFSLGTEFLFSEPSVRDAASLVSLQPGGNGFSLAAELEFIKAGGLFADVAGENPEGSANFNDGAETHTIFAVYTTKNYFSALGVPVLYGRGILPGDPDTVAVLQYGFWRKYFHQDPAAVGRTISLDGRLCTIVGILPEQHRTLIGFGYAPAVYLPVYLSETPLSIYARLRPGMSEAAARAGSRVLAKRMDADFGGHQPNESFIRLSHITGFARLSGPNAGLTLAVAFGLLLAISGLVLLVACVNVAGLLLARAASRRPEIALRLALGASRGRLLQQLLLESLWLALPGAVLGLLLSQVTAGLLARAPLELPYPILLRISPDLRLALYAALLTSVATVASGLLPAWQSVRDSLAPDLPRDRKQRLRHFLVAAQVAVCVVLLATGFLFLRNLADAGDFHPGFDVTHTLQAGVTLPTTFSGSPRKMEYTTRVLNELAALPGISVVAATRRLPFTGYNENGGQLTFPDDDRKVQVSFEWNSVTPGYFAAMDISFRMGTTFPATTFPTTTSGAIPVVVNETFVARCLAGRAPLGTTFRKGPESPLYRIAGVVRATKTNTIGEEWRPQVYEPLREIPDTRFRLAFVARSLIPPARQLDAVRHALHRLEPTAAAEVSTVLSGTGLAFLPSRIGGLLLGSLGALGLLLAAIGLYGVMVYSVARRTREIGIRMAVGATRSDIARMVLRDAARLTLTGSVIGLFIASFLTRPLAIFLIPGLKSSDPSSLAAVSILMVATGFVAAWGPMRRAMNVDPNVSLRDE